MNTIAGASRRRAVIASAWKTCSRVYPRLGRKVSRFCRGRRFDLSKLNRAQLHCAARSYLAELHRSRCLFEKNYAHHPRCTFTFYSLRDVRRDR